MQRPADELREHLEGVTGAHVDGSLLALALTHRSYAYENGALPHNERLEFLGDSVLGLVVTDTLYAAHPDQTEGHLAKLRAAVVNMRALADVGRTLGIGDYVRLGRGEETTGGRDKSSILADTTEALIGAVYLSAGMPAAANLVHHLLDPLMAASAELGAGLDWKTSLQEASSVRDLGGVEYAITDTGPEHEKVFTANVVIAGEVRGTGTGRTKKDAEQAAAAQAWRSLQPLPAAGADGLDGQVRPAHELAASAEPGAPLHTADGAGSLPTADGAGSVPTADGAGSLPTADGAGRDHTS